jgi:hypothetical protein
MKHLQIKLLDRLRTIRQEGFDGIEQTASREKLRKAFKEVANELDGEIATNFDALIDDIVFSFSYNIDRMIRYLEQSVDRSFDVETRKEDIEEGFDSCYGTDTGLIMDQLELPEIISLERLKFSTRFIPTPIRIFKLLLKLLHQYGVRYEEWVFMDIGSGLGRNLMLASEYPFKAIIGVEISSYLCERARENIEKYNAKSIKPCKAEVICSDVLDFDLPEEDATLYFWEPFNKVIMRRFIDRIEARIRDHFTRYILIFLENAYLDDIQSSVLKFLGTEYGFYLKSEEERSIMKISYYASVNMID